MILVLSTSSPVASLAAFSEGGELLWCDHREAPREAGKACLQFIEAWGRLGEVSRIVTDIGPGSFTGVRVGVTLAKTLAWARNLPVAGVSAFDLVGGECVAIPSRKGQWIVRSHGVLELVNEFPREGQGYGIGMPNPNYPLAERAVIGQLQWQSAESLLPEYLLEPNISVPKTPYLPGAIHG